MVPQPLQPLMKPGGHGALWKLMLDTGTFTWLAARNRQAAIIRQIRCLPVPIIIGVGLFHAGFMTELSCSGAESIAARHSKHTGSRQGTVASLLASLRNGLSIVYHC